MTSPIQGTTKTEWATFIDIPGAPICIGSKGYAVENKSIPQPLFASQEEIEQKVAMPISRGPLDVKRLFLVAQQSFEKRQQRALPWKATWRTFEPGACLNLTESR